MAEGTALLILSNLQIVPVVYGHANYSAVAPPGSYIDVKSYSSMKELADHLIFLDKNDAMYNQHFWWKKHYEVAEAPIYTWNKNQGFCSLCQKLHSQTPYHTYD